MAFRIRDWQKFQHFRDRRPPWIKLYRDILDDVNWHELDPGAAKILVMLWLLASENDGYLPDIKTISFRLRCTEREVIAAISRCKHWVEHVDTAGDITSDIDLISLTRSREGEGEGEEERETETEREAEGEERAPPVDNFSPADTPPDSAPISRAIEIAVYLRQRGVVGANSANPNISMWGDDVRVTNEILDAALSKAHASLENGEAPGVNYLAKIVPDLLNPKPVKPKADEWWRSEAGIKRKAKELGMSARAGESWDQFKDRIRDEIRKREREAAA